MDKRGIFMVNSLAIVYDGSKILIGKREKDEYVRDLTWGFPGGRPTYDRSLEESLIDEVKKKTNIDIEVVFLYHARLFSIKPEFMLLYYLAKPKNKDTISGEKFHDVKWVEPSDVVKHFTTSTDEKISNLMNRLSSDPHYLRQYGL
jgi:ADP-ribose pyrophosphatase YjhB (NUDIX family)